MWYVYAYDKIWKDWMCCECKRHVEALRVQAKWESFSDRRSVTIEDCLYSRRKATMYEVADDGSIILKK